MTYFYYGRKMRRKFIAITIPATFIIESNSQTVRVRY